MQGKKILLLSLVIIALALIFAYQLKNPGLTERETLKLSDFPEVFKENTLIVVGDNASEVEKQAAEQIADYLKQITKNKPEIISSKNFKKFKHDYNLIILGTPKSNPVLKEVYEMTNTIRVNESYPGENKGILEILRNPWNKEKALLLVEGSDEWGVLSSSVVSRILKYMWKPTNVFITYKLSKLISKQLAIEISREFLGNVSLTPDYVRLVIYPMHPDFTSYHVYNTTTGAEIGYLEQLINCAPYMWLVSYKLNESTILIFVNAENGAIVGVMKNAKVSRVYPKIM